MTATYELYEDDAGEWRWRLVSRNGNIIADGSEGYASRGGVERAISRMQSNAPIADVLDYGTQHFEVYTDRAGEWRWRLVAPNGRILADSGEGYSSRSGARDGIARVQRDGDTDTVEEQ
ncbi:MAG: DUF1508 domain-containing protein [Halobacteriales archaeon]|nr:DUF1508 domain-containing protein [Halobacteriales archaeon]